MFVCVFFAKLTFLAKMRQVENLFFEYNILRRKEGFIRSGLSLTLGAERVEKSENRYPTWRYLEILGESAWTKALIIKEVYV